MNPPEEMTALPDTITLIEQDRATRWRRWLSPILLGLLVTAANIGIYWLNIDYRVFGAYAYLGVFIVTLVANATTIVPVPYITIVACIAGQSDSLVLVALAGALGSALGESVAFFIGRSGRAIAEETRFYGWVKQQLRHPWRAFVVLFGLAAPINPAFDVAGLAAGALGVPYWLFFVAVFLGRLIRFWGIGLAGAQWCASGGA
jgi:membrane protein YqaA with SNARE-associated domain